MSFIPLIPTEINSLWYRFPPTTLSFFSDLIVVEFTEDALGNLIQPMMLRISYRCCEIPVGEDGTLESTLFYDFQIFERDRKKQFRPRTVTSAFQVPPFFFHNQEGANAYCVDERYPGCGPHAPVTTVTRYTEFMKQIDQWIISADTIYGDKTDFIPFSEDFQGCESHTRCPAPGWYAQLAVDGDPFLDPIKVTDPLCIPFEGSELVTTIVTRFADLIVDKIISLVPDLIGLAFEINPLFAGILEILFAELADKVDVTFYFCPCPSGSDCKPGCGCLSPCPSDQHRVGCGCEPKPPCPDGQTYVEGCGCLSPCPDGKELHGCSCEDPCASGTSYVPGCGCLAPCPEGQTRNGCICLPSCPPGQQYIDGHGCMPDCPAGSFRDSDGVCKPVDPILPEPLSGERIHGNGDPISQDGPPVILQGTGPWFGTTSQEVPDFPPPCEEGNCPDTKYLITWSATIHFEYEGRCYIPGGRPQIFENESYAGWSGPWVHDTGVTAPSGGQIAHLKEAGIVLKSTPGGACVWNPGASAYFTPSAEGCGGMEVNMISVTPITGPSTCCEAPPTLCPPPANSVKPCGYWNVVIEASVQTQITLFTIPFPFRPYHVNYSIASRNYANWRYDGCEDDPPTLTKSTSDSSGVPVGYWAWKHKDGSLEPFQQPTAVSENNSGRSFTVDYIVRYKRYHP